MTFRAAASASAVVVVLTAIIAFAVSGGGETSPSTPEAGEPTSPGVEDVAAVASTTTAAPSTTASTSPPTTATTTTSAVSSTTTTTQPVPTTAASGYSAIPKPPGGPNAVAAGGALTKHLAADIADAFGFEVADVEAAVAAVELPPEAGGNPEGWLAPGRYSFESPPGAIEVVQAMVDRQVAVLEDRNVPRSDWYRVLTAASVIEKETYNQTEKPRVARVLNNRLAGGGPLQMDSIILYPVAEDRIFTTAEERASDQPYNSYRFNGLPPTPICSPDEASIDAFLDPPPGDWWFYVTIDLHSGETRFAVTYDDHKANVELLRAWLRDNPTP